jgi:hypothetical protein
LKRLIKLVQYLDLKLVLLKRIHQKDKISSHKIK